MTNNQIKQLAKIFAKQTQHKLSLNLAYSNFIELSKANCRPDTIDYYNKQWSYAKSFFNEINVQYLDDVDINIMTQMQLYFRKQDYSNNSINKFTDIVKMVYKFNYDHNFIDENPIRDLKKLKKVNIETITIPKGIKQKIFDWLNNLNNDNIFNVRDKLIIYLLNETGIRLNELLHIKTKNIFLDENTIHLDFTKTGESRDIYFTDSTKKYIMLYLSKIESKEYFFQNLVTHEPMTKTSVNKLLERIKNELDIHQSISPHKWRHTFATELMNSNVSMREIQTVLGHTELTTTQKYLHTERDKTKKDILDVLSSNIL